MQVYCACFLAGCTSTADSNSGSSPAKGADLKYSVDDFKKSSFCPPVVIRDGTSAMTIYERGHEADQSYVRYLASLGRTARECQLAGDTLNVKVGVAGRLVAGPKGAAGNVTLPIRIAVVKQVGGTGPLYTQLFKVPVSVTGPTFGANFNQVFDQVNVKVTPDDRNLIVYVGFDEGAPGVKKPPKQEDEWRSTSARFR